MNELRRPLTGCIVSLSISDSEDSESLGFPSSQINRVTLHVVSSLFGQGVGVAFGHDWREDGVMQAVYGIAREMQPVDTGSDSAMQPTLQNLLPWPDEPMLSAAEREQLSSTLLVERAGLPEQLRRFAELHPATAMRLPEFPYLRARALTHMRRRLNERAHARICVGGQRVGGQGRFPGIIEEALLTLKARKPLYLVGLLGGATRQVIDALEGASMPQTFCERSAGADAYLATGSRLEPFPDSDGDRDTSPERAWTSFGEAGVGGLADFNGLTTTENKDLLQTPSVERAVRLILTGLSRVYRKGN